MKKILIADDHEIVRNGLRLLINQIAPDSIITEVETCEEIHKVLTSQHPHFIILDMYFSDGNVFTLVREIVELYPSIDILIYSMNSEKLYAKRFLQMGARGFVSKQSSLLELKEAIEKILKGEIYISPRIREQLFHYKKGTIEQNPIDQLSDRELEVAEYVIAGSGTKEIAKMMHLEITSISTFRQRIFKKLRVNNVLELNEVFKIYREATFSC